MPVISRPFQLIRDPSSILSRTVDASLRLGTFSHPALFGVLSPRMRTARAAITKAPLSRRPGPNASPLPDLPGAFGWMPGWPR